MSSTEKKKRRIGVVLVDRANYGRMKPVMRAIAAHPAREFRITNVVKHDNHKRHSNDS